MSSEIIQSVYVVGYDNYDDFQQVHFLFFLFFTKIHFTILRIIIII
jgi:hypothetical protein